MKEIDFKALIISLTVCLSTGVAIGYFSNLHWLPASLMVLTAVLFNGAIISIEDNQPGGWDYNENETAEERKEFKSMLRHQWLFTIAAFSLSIVAYVYTSS